MVTIIVQYKLLTGYETKFYEWYTEMQQLVERFPGYISKEFLPSANDAGRVTTILRFDNVNNAGKWMLSEQRMGMLQMASEEIFTDLEEVIYTENVYWFNPNSSVTKKWKQILITFIAIFPLALLVPQIVAWLTSPLFLHALLIKAASVFVMVCLMVFWVMPFMIRITQKWLE